jgi:hypothetical protein
MFVVISLTLNVMLDRRNRQVAASAEIEAVRQETLESMQERPVRLQQTR